MRFAICDCDYKAVLKLKSQIYTYSEERKLDIVVDCYSNGEMLLKNNLKYGIIFLGYKLSGINGFETAKKIRLNNQQVSIIFHTNYTHFVFDAFKVSPFRFLITPVSDNQLYLALDDFFKLHGTDYPLLIKSGEDTVFLNTSKILYLEADNKHSIVHLSDRSLPCNQTMAKVYAVLPKNSFLKINRAFIVNYRYISRFNNEELILQNEATLRISRNYLKSFKESYNFIINSNWH